MSYIDQSLFFCVLFDNIGIFFYHELSSKAPDGDNTVKKWEESDKCKTMEIYKMP